MSNNYVRGIIKLSAECYPNNIYFKHAANGTTWHGTAGFTSLALIQSWIPQELQVVHELSQATTTFPSLQTAAEGRVDIVPDSFGQTYERYQFVDFSYPIEHDGVYIISSKNTQPTGLIFQGIYDTLSYILILISFFIMIAVLYISFLCFPKPGGGESVSFVQIALHLFGSIWGQPFPSEVQSIGVSTQTSIYLFTFLNFVIATMYGSLVISKMTLRKESSPINTLEDLGAKPEIRAYILKHSFMEDSINNFKVLQDMKDEERIDLISLSDFVDGGVFTNLRDRSHILIESKANFLFFRSKLEEKATYCLNDPSNYHFSKEILFSLYSGWLYRKKFELSGTINKNLMWLHAFGFTWNPKENAGIFSPNKFDYDCDFEDNGENPCSKYPSLKEDHRRLSLLHLHMIFKYLGFGLVLAFFAFVTEVAYFFIRPIFFSKCIYRLHI